MKKLLSVILAVVALCVSFCFVSCNTKSSFEEESILGNTYEYKGVVVKSKTGVKNISKEEEQKIVDRNLDADFKEDIEEYKNDAIKAWQNKELYFNFDGKGSYYTIDGGEKQYLYHSDPVGGKYIFPRIEPSSSYLKVSEDGSSFYIIYHDFDGEYYDDIQHGGIQIFVEVDVEFQLKG